MIYSVFEQTFFRLVHAKFPSVCGSCGKGQLGKNECRTAFAKTVAGDHECNVCKVPNSRNVPSANEGSILQNSFSAENFTDSIFLLTFGQISTQKQQL
jgi:hypothetical protein